MLLGVTGAVGYLQGKVLICSTFPSLALSTPWCVAMLYPNHLKLLTGVFFGSLTPKNEVWESYVEPSVMQCTQELHLGPLLLSLHFQYKGNKGAFLLKNRLPWSVTWALQTMSVCTRLQVATYTQAMAVQATRRAQKGIDSHVHLQHARMTSKQP